MTIIEEHNKKVRDGWEWMREHGFVQDEKNPCYWNNPNIDNGWMRGPDLSKNELDAYEGMLMGYKYEVIFSAQVDAHTHSGGETPKLAMEHALKEFDSYFGTTVQLDNVQTFRRKLFWAILEDERKTNDAGRVREES